MSKRVYEKSNILDRTELTETYALAEQNIYGSSRLGLIIKDLTIAERVSTADNTAGFYDGNGYFKDISVSTLNMDYEAEPSTIDLAVEVGNRRYELSNHLGNVLEVVSDQKICINSSGSISHYTSDVMQWGDYYAYGMSMDNRSGGEDYRFGFNGMEMDNEIKDVEGSSYDFGARIYDPRIGRWLSGDNYEIFYPGTSTYSAFGNNPILLTDPTGEILKDPYGNIVVTMTGRGNSQVSYNDATGSYRVNYEFISGYAYTDEGKKIPITIPTHITCIEKIVGVDESGSFIYEEVTDQATIDEITQNQQSNCHGLSRLNGLAWIDGYDPDHKNPPMGLVDKKTGKVSLDGYEKVAKEDAEKVIFFDNEWMISHEITQNEDGTWTAKDRNGDIVTGTFEEAAGKYYGSKYNGLRKITGDAELDVKQDENESTKIDGIIFVKQEVVEEAFKTGKVKQTPKKK